jgi:hypothetical protein
MEVMNESDDSMHNKLLVFTPRQTASSPAWGKGLVDDVMGMVHSGA